MIGATYQAPGMAAIIGPNHSTEIPDTLYGAWLDGSLAIIADTGARVYHESFEIVGGQVENTAEVGAGVLPSGAVYFAVTDAAVGGNVVIYGTPDLTGLSPGDSVIIPAGSFIISYTE